MDKFNFGNHMCPRYMNIRQAFSDGHGLVLESTFELICRTGLVPVSGGLLLIESAELLLESCTREAWILVDLQYWHLNASLVSVRRLVLRRSYWNPRCCELAGLWLFLAYGIN